jgi:CAAX amino terminal protease family.
MRKGLFEESSGFTKISLLLLIFFFFALFSIIVLLIIKPISADWQEGDVLRLNLFIQNSIIFIATPFIAQFLLWKEPTKKALQLYVPNLFILLWGILAMASIGPLIDLLNTWNQSIHLPESMKAIEQWMANTEKNADITTKALLNISGLGRFISNIVVIAIMAGIGEELMFRGVLQKILIKWTGNIHWGVISAAIIFSAIHFQFFGFVPRMILGMVLGYLFVWSKSIWVPIAAHTINNALTVIFTPTPFNKGNKFIEEISKTPNTMGYVLAGTVIFAFCMWKIWNYYQVKADMEE